MDLPLVAELKRRRVFRALIGYGIAAFAILQVIEPVMHGLHWPDAVLSYVVVALAVGFPVVVSLAWIFDVNQGHIERTAGPNRIPLMVAIGLATAAPGLLWFFAFRKPAAAPVPTSVAVLPFVNMSSDKETDYFSDGITEELINALANVDGLRVASRTAVFAMRGKDLALKQIADQLNVGTLVEGSVRRDGNALRVTAQLIKVSDGYHLWSKTYDRELKGIFAVEDEIARSIASALQRTLIGVKSGTSSVEAHDLYLKGRYFLNKRNAVALHTAASLFEQATNADPSYALAYAELADTLALFTDYDAAGDEVLVKGNAMAQRALQIDPDLGEAHAALGLIATMRHEWETASKELHRAIELSPNYVMAHKWLGDLYDYTGREEEARAAFKRALEIDPASLITRNSLAETWLHTHEYAKAEKELLATLEMDPTFQPSHGSLAEIYAFQGKVEQSFDEIDKLNLDERDKDALRAYALAVAGRRQEALAIAERLGQPGKSPPWVGLAAVWTALGDKDRAFALLMPQCARMHPDNVEYEPLRSDPRFQELRRCAKLP